MNTYHVAQCNDSGKLIPWNIDSAGPFDYIMMIEGRWWLNAPNVSGWPTYLTAAQLDHNYSAFDGAIPASTVAMAIEAYLKYYAYTGDTVYLNMVRTMADYIIQQDLTPETYVAYPKFPWPVGSTGDINPDGSGHPGNVAGNIMPDKGAMIGIALVHLYEATGSIIYLNEAIQIADVLANNAVLGSEIQSPWPFRAEADSGVLVEGPIMGNQVFALRLYDELIRLGIVGNGKYQATRDNVRNWLKNVAIADGTGDKWMHFFEDQPGAQYNPTQFDALEMARYLLERKDALDPDWFAMAGSLINLVKNRWIVHSGDYTAVAEQELDLYPYNSHTARYASILSKYYEAGGPADYKDEAFSSFAYSTYSVGFDGFADTYFNQGIAWTSDSFGDWMQHFMDGVAAIAEWAPGNSDHLLRSSSVVQSVTYGFNTLSYGTFDAAGQEKLKLSFTPTDVRVDGSSIATWSWDSQNQVLVVDRVNGTQVEILGGGTGPEFSVSAVPGSRTVVHGDSTSYAVNVSARNGFSGAVDFSVSGLPNDATATFTPASVSTSGSSTLNVTTSLTTPAGSYTLTVTGTSGSLTHSANVTLAVNPSTGFSLSATPSSQTVVQGSSTTYTATVSGLNGFSGAVDFSVTGLPSGATATFSPTSVIGSGSSTLAVTTSLTTPSGSYTLTIQGASGSVTLAVDVTLSVTSTSVVITFDDLSPGDTVLSGQYPTGVINWGSENWYLSSPWGLFTTQSISFNGPGPTIASFTFLSNSGLASLQAYNGGSTPSTVTISCSGQPDAQATVPAGQLTTINTGWTNSCSTVTLASTNGWYTNFDDLAIFAGPSSGP